MLGWVVLLMLLAPGPFLDSEQVPKVRPAPPVVHSLSIAPRRRVGTDSVVRGVVLDNYSIVLDSTETLATVQSMLGRTSIHEPLHHDDLAWTCYRLPIDGGVVYLRLESDDVGGPSHRVMGFRIQEGLPNEATPADCPVTHRFHAVRTDNGIAIGMAIQGVLAIMHTPKERSANHYKFEYFLQVRSDTLPAYDVDGTLNLETRDGRVTRITAWYAETS